MAAAASEPGNYRNAIALVVLGALLLFVAMMAAVELHLPIAGAPRSIARMSWIVGMVSSMLVGAVGLGMAVHWLAGGDPAKQFGESRLRR